MELPDCENNALSCNKDKTNPTPLGVLLQLEWSLQNGQSNWQPEEAGAHEHGPAGIWAFHQRSTNLGLPFTHSAGRTSDTKANQEKRTKYGMCAIALQLRKSIDRKNLSSLDSA